MEKERKNWRKTGAISVARCLTRVRRVCQSTSRTRGPENSQPLIGGRTSDLLRGNIHPVEPFSVRLADSEDPSEPSDDRRSLESSRERADNVNILFPEYARANSICPRENCLERWKCEDLVVGGTCPQSSDTCCSVGKLARRLNTISDLCLEHV